MKILFSLMLHDALFMLWGCKTPDIEIETAYVTDSDRELYMRIAEIADTYHQIKSFTELHSYRARKIQTVRSQHCIIGLYSQALSESIDAVLQDNQSRLVEIESCVLSDERLSLSFIFGKVQTYQSLFYVLNKVIAHINDLKLHGCQILAIIQQHMLTGNELVRGAMLKIYSHINSVFVNQLISWLLYGELKDDYKEFFINKIGKEANETKETLVSSHSAIDKTGQSLDNCTLLDSEYSIEVKLLPYFIPLSLAQEILFIGKTVLLFGFDPKDISTSSKEISSSFLSVQKTTNKRRFTIWDEKEAEFHAKLQKLKEADESYFHNSRLKLTIKEIKACVTRHLWSVTVEEAKLLEELKLMKDFYLLGRGELFLELLRLSSNILENPVTRTSGRDMNQAFQLAARAVFLDNNTDVEKFFFEIPYVKPNTTDSSFEGNKDGWSTIMLKYKFKWPLHLLFSPEVLAQYNDMFRFLLRIKKTQHDLHALWKVYRRKKSGRLFELHNKLMFVMDNLQHYLQADVLDTNFSKFMTRTEATRDFEELKQAHSTFLQDILSQSFLYSSDSSDSGSSFEESELRNPVLCNIMDLLKLCHSFCSMNEQVEDPGDEAYYLIGYSQRFDTVMSSLLQMLASRRSQLCGTYLARLLMRLDYNRWFSNTAHLTQSVTNMLN